MTIPGREEDPLRAKEDLLRVKDNPLCVELTVFVANMIVFVTNTMMFAIKTLVMTDSSKQSFPKTIFFVSKTLIPLASLLFLIYLGNSAINPTNQPGQLKSIFALYLLSRFL